MKRTKEMSDQLTKAITLLFHATQVHIKNDNQDLIILIPSNLISTHRVVLLKSKSNHLTLLLKIFYNIPSPSKTKIIAEALNEL